MLSGTATTMVCVVESSPLVLRAKSVKPINLIERVLVLNLKGLVSSINRPPVD